MNSRFVFLMLLFVACHSLVGCSDRGDPVSPEYFQLRGKWNWIQSVGGLGGTWTPDNQPWTMSLEFRQDGQFIEQTAFRDSVCISSGFYSVSRELNVLYLNFKPTYASFTRYLTPYRYRLDRIDPDTLVYSDLAYDGYQYTWVRSE
jgi:hypothetical protein